MQGVLFLRQMSVILLVLLKCRFNPRARTGRDFLIVHCHTSLKMFQSTRPHGARLQFSALILGRNPVSIHAPARGATVCARRLLLRRGVSIHAPARGATGTGFRHQGAEGVSIHAPARGATNSASALLLVVSVSIHAPARGATYKAPTGKEYEKVSIHAPARGATRVDA